MPTNRLAGLDQSRVDPSLDRAVTHSQRLGQLPPGQLMRLGLGLGAQVYNTLTTANQIKSVTVNGWNRATRRAISETITLDDRELNRLNPNLHEMLNVCDPREEYVVDEPVHTVDQAKQRARAILRDQLKNIVKSNGTTVGLPDLRAGQRVQITNLGARFSGTYFVTATTHTINDSGYTTNGYASDGFTTDFDNIPQPIKMLQLERPIEDFLASLICDNLFHRFPNLRQFLPLRSLSFLTSRLRHTGKKTLMARR